jgi:FkbM family methyltransferase
VKNKVIHFLQSLLGFEHYLFVFARFVKIKLPYDSNEKDFLKIFNLIPQDGILLDIGANIGVMTTVFAQKRPHCTIFSFEPIPQNYKTLQKMVAHFKLKNVQVFKLALGAKQGKVKMHMPEMNNAKKQGLSHVVSSKYNPLKGEYFEVEINALDLFEPTKNAIQKIEAIKIDVEGYELEVLMGAKALLLKNKPVVYCELWQQPQRNQTLEFMKSLGYECFVADNHAIVPYQQQQSQNFFFIYSK